MESDSRQFREESLTVREVLQYMSSLARLHADSRTGNLLLKEALRDLVNALGPYARFQVSELKYILHETKRRREVIRGKDRTNLSLPSQPEGLSHENVEEILRDEGYTKLQLIELGALRFGISRSRLMRIARKDVIATIRAAVDHERSLGVISQEARRDGAKRTS